jgi:hypothetical protein
LFTSLVHEQEDIEEVREWADEIVGDTHLGKRKRKLGPSERKEKRVKFTDQIEKKKRMKTVIIAQPTLVQVIMEKMAGMVMVGGDARSYGVEGSGMRDHIKILST